MAGRVALLQLKSIYSSVDIHVCVWGLRHSCRRDDGRNSLLLQMQFCDSTHVCHSIVYVYVLYVSHSLLHTHSEHDFHSPSANGKNTIGPIFRKTDALLNTHTHSQTHSSRSSTITEYGALRVVHASQVGSELRKMLHRTNGRTRCADRRAERLRRERDRASYTLPLTRRRCASRSLIAF